MDEQYVKLAGKCLTTLAVIEFDERLVEVEAIVEHLQEWAAVWKGVDTMQRQEIHLAWIQLLPRLAEQRGRCARHTGGSPARAPP